MKMKVNIDFEGKNVLNEIDKLKYLAISLYLKLIQFNKSLIINFWN
jgi:hypothetical protein